MVDSSVKKGERVEGLILAKFLEMGLNVSIPFGQSCRYDFIVESEGKLEKVQCKTARIYKGRVVFNGYSIATNTKRIEKRPYTSKEIDYFVAYCPETKKFYKVPIELATKTDVVLRVEPFKENFHGSQYNVKWAKDFEF